MHIVITGASKGIGLSIAEIFARETAGDLRLSICSRNPEEIAQASLALTAINPSASIFGSGCDVASEQAVAQFSETAIRQHGPADILINNAGFGIFKKVEDFSAEDFRSVIATNLRGVFLVTRAFLDPMIAQKSGTILTISSLAGKNGFAGGSAYCAAKFGVRGLMNSLFLEVRQHNIRVITLFPGSVQTDFFHDPNSSHLLSAKALQASDIARTVLFATQLPATATISELDIRPTNPKG